MSNLVKEFEQFIEENKDEFVEEFDNIEELLMLGCKYYYVVIRSMDDDYITKKDIESSLEENYSDFFEQSGIIDVFEKFIESNKSQAMEFYNEFDDAYKDKILNYLKNNVDEIADYANDTDED